MSVRLLRPRFGVRAKTRLHAGAHEVGAEAVGATRVDHVERAVGAVESVGPTFVALGALEARQHVGVAPSGVAFGSPLVIVTGVAARVDHRVDRTRPAQHLAARLVAASTAQAGLRHRFEGPVRMPGPHARSACPVRAIKASPAGHWINTLLSAGPASTRHTLVFRSSLSRPASTEPAEPPPMTM
jgi:hypothetical protein